MKTILRSLFVLSSIAIAAQASAQITFYEADNFRGRTFNTHTQRNDFTRIGFNDKASSVIVDKGRWEVCNDVNFGGRCMILRQGSYSSLSAMGLNDKISSVRAVKNNGRYDNEAPEPMERPNYDYRRRPNEKNFNAEVTSVRAIVGPPTQRCWVERQQVEDNSRRESNVGGAIAGALIGGILGHQVGGGRGKDIATVGGAIAGGAIGSQVGRDQNDTYSKDVRRCENVPDKTPEFWDVTYQFRGRQHRVQMTYPPGATISVNKNGEPRG
jgi:uncharacterized protein YcfJ